MENLNIAYPFQDFDSLDGSPEEHKERFHQVNSEVLTTMLVNSVIHSLMLLPLWYTGSAISRYIVSSFDYLAASQIQARHEFLVATIGVTKEEILSYTVAYNLPIGMTVAVLTTSLLAVLTFLLYNYKVRGRGELKYF